MERPNLEYTPNLNEGNAVSAKHRSLILASSSPRRKELLAGLGLSFHIQPSHISEEVDKPYSPEELVQVLARQKAQATASQLQSGLVLGADTIVVLDECILGKPENEEDAFNMLKLLQNQRHDVYSGVALYDIDHQQLQVGYQQTRVKMKSLSDEEILQYIKTREPLDKAGSYAIQGIGATLIEDISGDYFTVVGLPLSLTASFLKKAGIDVLQLGTNN